MSDKRIVVSTLVLVLFGQMAVADSLRLVATADSVGHVLDTNYFGISELDGEGDCAFSDPSNVNNGCLSRKYFGITLTIPYEAIDPGLTSFPPAPFFQVDSEVCLCINDPIDRPKDCVSFHLSNIPSTKGALNNNLNKLVL